MSYQLKISFQEKTFKYGPHASILGKGIWVENGNVGRQLTGSTPNFGEWCNYGVIGTVENPKTA